ncbi:SDR family NAD(P)-dependent oxidoreductase [Neogemmobacter tilapiae]|uniref:Short-chain dehydrogenase n=1 Tax=Neogemmobacter tilapiae TaxID=875041 RepID=A0A918WFZ3_9RHOB|nr:SDR family NAD(P)-dependent oxidoreductase [Gemmobacter tilapiae]GHC43098.1 short-chain dehydrogenase [Gemmobacter tilapiae]
MNLSNKTALVTGGNRGIGRAAALALLGAGARVSYTTRRAGEPIAGATEHICDMLDAPGMDALLGQGFDILVNNAGVIGPIGRLDQVDPNAWAKNIATNLTAAFRAVQTALRARGPRGLTVVNLSSGAARRPLEGWSAYCAGKAGLAMLTRSLHEEFGGQGLRVFGFAPGVVDTGMQGEIRASGINPVSQVPQGDLANPAEPGQAIAWLCSAAADQYCGQEVDIRDAAFRQACGLPAL